MTQANWPERDRRQMADRGLTVREVERQLELLRNPPPAVRLAAPATPGHGIRVLTGAETEAARAAHAAAAAAGRITSFVPASGAASRMFKTLLGAIERGGEIRRDEVARAAAAGGGDARELLDFIEGLPRFAFFGDLEATLRRDGHDLRSDLARGEFRFAIAALLAPDGLDAAGKAKGLLPFHRYPGGRRTAFEEHLIEATQTCADSSGTARLHFTVSGRHRRQFEDLLSRVRSRVEPDLGVRFEVGFSEQSPATDTVAIDDRGEPFREPDGSLLFRPGGHGSLIANLSDLGADLLLVKNIDNIVPDHLRPPCIAWKRVTAGLLALSQARVFAALEELGSDPASEASIAGARRLLEHDLCVPLAPGFDALPSAGRAAELRRLLDRPLRVCGMVRATGDPGGGPFWVAGTDGRASLQIVETAQVDTGDPEQARILASATHFNPVDLACGLRDRLGRPYDLRRYVDPATAFIASKSSGGRELRALEHPGLWNGAMADWTTLFVEVPVETFNPVKTVNDLLRPQHQPPAD